MLPSLKSLLSLSLCILVLGFSAAFIHWYCELWIRTGALLVWTDSPLKQCPKGRCAVLIVELLIKNINETKNLNCLSAERVQNCYSQTNNLFCKVNNTCADETLNPLTGYKTVARHVCNLHCGVISFGIELALQCEMSICHLLCLNGIPSHGDLYLSGMCAAVKKARTHADDFVDLPAACLALMEWSTC